VRLFGQKKEGGKKTGGASLLLPKIRKNPLIEIIPINTGCLNQCTYCKTKHARGDLGSYPPGMRMFCISDLIMNSVRNHSIIFIGIFPSSF
jgi:tRNA A37 methylthiotransferase MiaB